MPDHIVKSFKQELLLLTGMLVRMGGLVDAQLGFAAAALLHRDAEAARRAVEDDAKTDAMEREIENFAVRMLALRQPMAGDLRVVVGALKMTGDLERIGDYASNVAKRGMVLAQFATPYAPGGLAPMMLLVRDQVASVVEAIATADCDKAVEVWQSDRAVDDLYNTIFRETVTYMMEDARNITPSTHLLFIAKNLERIGDHTTNIAETIYYAVKGENLPDDRPRGHPSVTPP